MVEDHIENHLDACGMQRPDHFLELPHLAARLAAGGITPVRGEEGHRVIAPIVRAFTANAIGSLRRELMDRHQFDGGDTE